MLAYPLPEFEARILYKASKKSNKKHEIVWQILFGRTNEEIEILKKTFLSTFQLDMGTFLKNELHADYENLILQSLKTTEDVFSDDIHTDKNAEKDAARFVKQLI